MTLTIAGIDGRVAQRVNLNFGSENVQEVACRAPGPGVVMVCCEGECVKVVSLR